MQLWPYGSCNRQSRANVPLCDLNGKEIVDVYLCYLGSYICKSKRLLPIHIQSGGSFTNIFVHRVCTSSSRVPTQLMTHDFTQGNAKEQVLNATQRNVTVRT